MKRRIQLLIDDTDLAFVDGLEADYRKASLWGKVGFRPEIIADALDLYRKAVEVAGVDAVMRKECVIVPLIR